jgi:nucleoside-diphosphate-sugar epimerase
MDRMPRINVEGTKLLAASAERACVKTFGCTSSVAVYGSGLTRHMSEDSPILTVDRDVRSKYRALDYVRTYGRTKRAVYALNWSLVKRTLAAHRHAHHIYVRDVTDAIIWSIERAITGVWALGSGETFNHSEDEFPEPTHANFMRKAFAAGGDKRFCVIRVPWIADWMYDLLRFRTLPLRNPLWRMRFPNDRLRATGYRHRFGMAEAHARAPEALQKESQKLPQRESS